MRLGDWLTLAVLTVLSYGIIYAGRMRNDLGHGCKVCPGHVECAHLRHLKEINSDASL